MMEEIVSSEGGEHEIAAIATDKIEFPKLKELRLEDLPSFTAICKAMNAIELPQLSSLTLSNMPKLNLCPASDSESNCNPIIQPLFNDKAESTEEQLEALFDYHRVQPFDVFERQHAKGKCTRFNLDGWIYYLSYSNFTWQGPDQPACQENMNLYIKRILPSMKDFNCPRCTYALLEYSCVQCPNFLLRNEQNLVIL
ncbi:hypothetical protein ACSBR1_035062 [Camellia fascicularis]